MARKKHWIRKTQYAEEYWNKYENKIKDLFPYGKKQFDSYVKNTIEEDKFLGKAKAKQALGDMLDEIKYGADYLENKIALREYAEEEGVKLSKFNNKKFTSTPVDLSLQEETDWKAHGNFHATEMVEISNSDLVVLKGILRLDSGSPIEYTKVVDGSTLSV